MKTWGSASTPGGLSLCPPAEPLFKMERTRGAQEPAECCDTGEGDAGPLLSTRQPLGVGVERYWLPVVDTFRTLAACRHRATIAVIQQIHTLAGA